MDPSWLVARGHRPCPAPLRCTARPFRPSSSLRHTNSSAPAPPPVPLGNAHAWPCCCTTPPRSRTSRLEPALTCTPRRGAGGASAGVAGSSRSPTNPAGGASPRFPPLDKAVVVGLACERVAQTGDPLSRLSLRDLSQRASAELGKPISRTTVQRLLDADAIKPWQYEHWIFPRAPDFFAKAGVILDLYEGYWRGERPDPFDRLVSADEKTSIQARLRCHTTLPPGPRRRRRLEHEYQRGGALQYLAAWDVQDGIVIGRCEARTGIEPFGRLAQQVMGRPAYRPAPRRFWGGHDEASRRWQAAGRGRLRRAYPNAILVHTPVHASWLNQVEIYFSLVQRKALMPNDFADLADVELRLRLYEELTNRQPRPFDWRFTKEDLFQLLQR